MSLAALRLLGVQVWRFKSPEETRLILLESLLEPGSLAEGFLKKIVQYLNWTWESCSVMVWEDFVSSKTVSNAVNQAFILNFSAIPEGMVAQKFSQAHLDQLNLPSLESSLEDPAQKRQLLHALNSIRH